MLEAPCLRSTEVAKAMTEDSGKQVTSMAVDGGMTVNNFMMQLQSNFMNATIVRKKEQEITCMGVAIAAGLHVKYWNSLEDVENLIKIDQEFKP